MLLSFSSCSHDTIYPVYYKDTYSIASGTAVVTVTNVSSDTSALNWSKKSEVNGLPFRGYVSPNDCTVTITVDGVSFTASLSALENTSTLTDAGNTLRQNKNFLQEVTFDEGTWKKTNVYTLNIESSATFTAASTTASSVKTAIDPLIIQLHEQPYVLADSSIGGSGRAVTGHLIKVGLVKQGTNDVNPEAPESASDVMKQLSNAGSKHKQDVPLGFSEGKELIVIDATTHQVLGRINFTRSDNTTHTLAIGDHSFTVNISKEKTQMPSSTEPSITSGLNKTSETEVPIYFVTIIE